MYMLPANPNTVLWDIDAYSDHNAWLLGTCFLLYSNTNNTEEALSFLSFENYTLHKDKSLAEDIILSLDMFDGDVYKALFNHSGCSHVIALDFDKVSIAYFRSLVEYFGSVIEVITHYDSFGFFDEFVTLDAAALELIRLNWTESQPIDKILLSYAYLYVKLRAGEKIDMTQDLIDVKKPVTESLLNVRANLYLLLSECFVPKEQKESVYKNSVKDKNECKHEYYYDVRIMSDVCMHCSSMLSYYDVH